VSDRLEQAILSLVPADGASIGNKKLREAVSRSLGEELTEADYESARDALIAQGVLAKGKGRGGSVRRVEADPGAFDLRTRDAAAEESEAPKRKAKKASKRKAGNRKKGEATEVLSYRHLEKRRNNPQVGLVTPDKKRLYFYQNPVKSQRTNLRVNALLGELIGGGQDIPILAFSDQDGLDFRGIPLNVAAGLEDNLISMVQPLWNKTCISGNSDE